MTGRCWIPPNRKLFLTRLIQIRIFFSKTPFKPSFRSPDALSFWDRLWSTAGTNCFITSLHNISATLFFIFSGPLCSFLLNPVGCFLTPLWPSIQISLLLSDSGSSVSTLQSWYMGSILLHAWVESSVKDLSVSIETYSP